MFAMVMSKLYYIYDLKTLVDLYSLPTAYMQLTRLSTVHESLIPRLIQGVVLYSIYGESIWTYQGTIIYNRCP